MTSVFVSHDSHDDRFVRDLKAALKDHGIETWARSEEVRGGTALGHDIQEAIARAGSFALVVSPGALQSRWVGKELRHALDVQRRRGNDFTIILLSLDGTRLGVLEEFFDAEPLYIRLESGRHGVHAAVSAILAALGKRAPEPAARKRDEEPLHDLVLRLIDLKIVDKGGVRRASAWAQLIYEGPGESHTAESESWRLIAPLGPVESEELRWYLEKYAVWPSQHFRRRADKVEDSLATWARLLHECAFPPTATAVIRAWNRTAADAPRHFSVYVDVMSDVMAPHAELGSAREAAAQLLGLPWELLTDDVHLRDKLVCVRRRIPTFEYGERSLFTPPIRVLLVAPRPEDANNSFIDHRATALPLVEMSESLDGLLHVEVLDPPTFPAMCEALSDAARERRGYQVLHFDGHGVYDRDTGLTALCFEDPQDAGRLEQRRVALVQTDVLSAALREHRLPLVVLEACQAAHSERGSDSFATGLLKAGVSSVVAMSHSVLVETSRRFVSAFYEALGHGTRVGDAMVAVQRRLKEDTFRGRLAGAGELRLADWFVPVLFQGKDDPRLFEAAEAMDARKGGVKRAVATHLGEVPAEPASGFIGRSRDLLALERLLKHEQYVVIRAQGGEGKTALASECARWMVRSGRMQRAAFVSVEHITSGAALLGAIARQLVSKHTGLNTDDVEAGRLLIERALIERSTLLVIDNLDTILGSPTADAPEALADDAARELDLILGLCARFLSRGNTRIVFTSRQALPEPFAADRSQWNLRPLERSDAVTMVERALGTEERKTTEATREAIEQLVEAVRGHAQTLALLAPSLRSRGVDSTRESLLDLLAEMEKRYPGSRERSIFASLELSLRRLSSANRRRAKVLGLFHGGVQMGVLAVMMKWEPDDVDSLTTELTAVGLAAPERHNYIKLNSALCPYLREQIEERECEALLTRWDSAMHAYVGFLVEQRAHNSEAAATLTGLDLPNMLAFLKRTEQRHDPAAIVEVTTALLTLLKDSGRQQLLDRIARGRDAAVANVEGGWSHAHFESQRTAIERMLDADRLREALQHSQQLVERAREAGDSAYPGADYDLAGACWLLGYVLNAAGIAERALVLFGEARQRLEAISDSRNSAGANSLALHCLSESADCLFALGRLDEAEQALNESVRRAAELGNGRAIAVGKGQLGRVLLARKDYSGALEAFDEARQRFEQLAEPSSVAVAWYQRGVVLQEMQRAEEAEGAYRQALAIQERVGNLADTAGTLVQLGNLYASTPDRSDEAASLYEAATGLFRRASDRLSEGRVSSNLAELLRKRGQFAEARGAILRAIECKTSFGHAGQIWVSLDILAEIELALGNVAGAQEAKRKAIDCYVRYRRDGGGGDTPAGALVDRLIQLNRDEGGHAVAAFVDDLDTSNLSDPVRSFVEALRALAHGNRDSARVDDLNYKLNGELLFLGQSLNAE